MPTVVLKLFVGQGTRQMDGRTKWRLYASPFGEHKNSVLGRTINLQYKLRLQWKQQTNNQGSVFANNWQTSGNFFTSLSMSGQNMINN